MGTKNFSKDTEHYKQSVYLLMDALEKSDNQLKTTVLLKDLEDTIESFKRDVLGDNWNGYHELTDEQLSAKCLSLVGAEI